MWASLRNQRSVRFGSGSNGTPYDLVFAYTLNTFLKSQDEIETKSQHECSKGEHINQE